MAFAIDTRPVTADLQIYGGDTFEMVVATDVDYSSYTWTAQVRATHSGSVDASFTIGASVLENGFHKRTLTLSATDTRTLADGGAVLRTSISQRSFSTVYNGVWDVQVELNGVVRTLAQGDIKVEMDVTR